MKALVSAAIIVFLVWMNENATAMMGHELMPMDKLYLGLAYKASKITGRPANFAGAELGMVGDSGIEAGLEVYSTLSDITPEDRSDLENLQLVYGGFHFAVSPFPQASIRPKINIGIGFGRVSFQQTNKTANASLTHADDGGDGHGHQGGMFSFEPGLFGEATIHPSVDLGLGGSYRLLNGTADAELSGLDLSGLTVSVYVRFRPKFSESVH